MKKLRIFIFFLFIILMSQGYKINAQGVVGLKKITSELKKIAGSSKFLYYENDALALINKGKNTYKYGNDKDISQYEKFLEAESQIKEIVKKVYLNEFEQDKKNLLAETIPGSPRYFESEAARHLILFAVDPSIEEDFNSLKNYANFMIELNNLHIDVKKGIKQEHILKLNTINSQFKKNKYYKEVDNIFEESICNNNRKHLESFKINMQWIAKHLDNRSIPLNEIKDRFFESERIAESRFINNSCLDGYAYKDSLAKYELKIENFGKNSDKPTNAGGLITNDPKRIDCSCTLQILESAKLIKVHYTKGLPLVHRLVDHYFNGIGEDYYRYLHDALTEEAREFHTSNFEVIAFIMWDLQHDIRSERHVLAATLVAQDMEARKAKVCQSQMGKESR